MKKFLATALTALLLLAFFSACGGSMDAPRNGTYRSSGILAQTWTLSGSNNITMSTVGGLVSSSGTWSIDGDRLTITLTGPIIGTQVLTHTITEITRDSFRIDGTLFERQ